MEYNFDTFRKSMVKDDMKFSGGPEPGQPAPEFDLSTTTGDRFKLADYRDQRPVFIEFASIT